MTKRTYDDEAERAEAGTLGPARRHLSGDDARASAQQTLMDATGAANVDDAVRIALGRPRVGEESGPSPVVRARVPETLKQRITQLAKEQQRRESDIVRDALNAYAEKHASS